MAYLQNGCDLYISSVLSYLSHPTEPVPNVDLHDLQINIWVDQNHRVLFRRSNGNLNGSGALEALYLSLRFRSRSGKMGLWLSWIEQVPPKR